MTLYLLGVIFVIALFHFHAGRIFDDDFALKFRVESDPSLVKCTGTIKKPWVHLVNSIKHLREIGKVHGPSNMDSTPTIRGRGRSLTNSLHFIAR